MFKDKIFKCRVCDSCGKIVEIPGLECFPDEDLYEIKNLETGRTDEICDDCLNNRAFTCSVCGDSFYNANKIAYNGFYYCPDCAEKRAENLKREYFNFIEKGKEWKKERNKVENNEN